MTYLIVAGVSFVVFVLSLLIWFVGGMFPDHELVDDWVSFVGVLAVLVFFVNGVLAIFHYWL